MKKLTTVKSGLAFALVAALAIVTAPFATQTAQADGTIDNDKWSYKTHFGGEVSDFWINRVPQDIRVWQMTAPQTEATSVAPAMIYAYVNAGETVTARFGGKSYSGSSWTENIEGYNIGAAYAHWTIASPSGTVLQSNDGPRLNEPTNSAANGLLRGSGAWFRSDTEQFGQPTAFTAQESGVYAFAVRNYHYGTYRGVGFPWDIGISNNGTDVPGRVWVEELGISDTFSGISSPRYANFGANYEFNLLAENGYQYSLGLNGYHGMNTTIAPNAFGNTDANCTPVYQSLMSSQAKVPCGGKYRIFFETPSLSMPEAATSASLDDAGNWHSGKSWVLPKISEETLGLTMSGTGTPAAPLARTITVSNTKFIGTAYVEIDADGDGSYGGPNDRSIPLSFNSGNSSLTVNFDGLDGAGVPIPADRIVRVRAASHKNPEIHVRIDDAEQIRDGIQLNRLNGQGIAEDRVYWDDSAVANLTTCSTDYPGSDPAIVENPVSTVVNGKQEGILATTPRVHRWTTSAADSGCLTKNSWGEDRYIDHWSYGDSTVTSDTFYLGKQPTYAIGDYVWIDVNADGKQDASEPGLEGVSVTAKLSGTNTVLQTATTDANGLYVFDGLAAGTYDVSFGLTPQQQAKYEFTQTGSDSRADAQGTVASVNLTDTNTSLDTAYTKQAITATQGIDATIDAGVSKVRAPFSLHKEIAGSGKDLVGADTSFTVDYSYPAGTDFAAGTGSVSIKADGTVVDSDPVPVDAKVSIKEQTPAKVTGGTWKAPTYSKETFDVTGTGISHIVTNTITKDSTVTPTPTPSPSSDKPTPIKPSPTPGKKLPNTGSANAPWLVGAAVLAILGGGGILALRRNRVGE